MLLPTNRPALMGIINVTPDSFSDGGILFEAAPAIEAGHRMIDEGADMVDIGGESTRPHAEPVSIQEELRRVMPVVEGLAAKGIVVSIDTMKPEVAKAALQGGAQIVNDVTALSAPGMLEACVAAECTVCLMHMKGDPRTMQTNPAYENVVTEIRDYLVTRASMVVNAGLPSEKIWIDPGIGFGKTVAHNLSLLKHLDVFTATGYPVLVGVSRKSFLGRLDSSGEMLPAEARLEGTLAAQVLAQAAGARIIRAHDVRQARRAIDLAAAVLNAD